MFYQIKNVIEFDDNDLSELKWLYYLREKELDLENNPHRLVTGVHLCIAQNIPFPSPDYAYHGIW